MSTPQIPTVTVANVPDPLPQGVSVLDVREPDEWAAGHIEGAVHIPLGQLAQRVAEVPSGETLVVCAAGGRSGRAAAYLLQQGHDATNLDGGMRGWEAAGRPMISENGEPATAL